MKSYTDLEQSRKLAKILPIESADMSWKHYVPDFASEGYGISLDTIEYNTDIPCWSLAALLSVLPFHLIVNNQRYAFSMCKGLNKGEETYIFRYNVFNSDVCLYATDYYNNPVDAAFEMVCWLC